MNEFSVTAECSACGAEVTLTWADVGERYAKGPIRCAACREHPRVEHAPEVTLDEIDAGGAVAGVKIAF